MFEETTVAASVYGALLINPGMTVRCIREMIQCNFDFPISKAVNAALATFQRNGAVISLHTPGLRKATYYPTLQPVVLRNPANCMVNKRNLQDMHRGFIETKTNDTIKKKVEEQYADLQRQLIELKNSIKMTEV